MLFRALFLILYAFLGGIALWGAFTFRFYFDPLPFRYEEMLFRLMPWALVLKGVSAELLGLTRAIWRYASFRDLKSVVLAAIVGSILFFPVAWTLTEGAVPNGVLLLDALLTVALFTGIRFSGRFWAEGFSLFKRLRGPDCEQVLILGGGSRGEIALRVIGSMMSDKVRVIGLLDQGASSVGRTLHGIPVLGTPADLGQVLMGRDVQEIVMALPDKDPEEVRRVFLLASAAGASVSIMPEMAPLEEHAHTNPIRELRMSDFLGRAPVALDPEPLQAALQGQRVLVTGAGGSIGSELCRQLAQLPLAELVLLDFSETALFEIMEELRSAECGVRMELCDIRNRSELHAVFETHHPDVVIHAAACKHVPMMEQHPLEAARTNVLGTRNVVEAAKAIGVERLMHVSTDKAVNPEGVMGASKAWSERVAHAVGYACVRFGNVLGSSGSVIPLFEKQWSRSGKLQVTHKDATRYFMTIEEAVLLILHAEALREAGRIYVLDMGEPIRILDVARQMVALRAGGAKRMEQGAEGTEDHIEIVGLRPGERLHERLHTEVEALKETGVEKIRFIASVDADTPEASALADTLTTLEEFIASLNEEGVRSLLLGE